jgi:peptide-methionine (S)-S-oxide reductase
MAKAIFGAGCFWGVEHSFRQLPGVEDAVSGYSGGTTDNPTYREVCSGTTGHAEVVEVTYDPGKISYDNLLDHFFEIHDPTQVNRQGPDVGTQYRSAVFTLSDEQAEAARAAVERHQPDFDRPIATVIEPAGPFWRAEDYHQRYFEKNGVHGCAI